MQIFEEFGITNQQALSKICQEGFLEFCMAIDRFENRFYTPTWMHQILANKLQQVYEKVKSKQKVRLIIQMPPRSGKSRAASVLFPAWALGKDPSISIACCSYSFDLAEKFGQEARDVFSDEVYKIVFPQSRLRMDTAAKANWMTTSGGSYFATGVLGGLTGRGYKIGLIDDAIRNRQDADSEVYRESLWNWFTSTFYTRQEGKTGICLIGTRWHLDDLIGRVLEMDVDHEWEVIRFPAIAEEDEKYRKRGEPLWPDKFDLQHLEDIKQKDFADWSSLYQQSPILQENAMFRKEWFKYFEEKDIAHKHLDVFVTVDLAYGQLSSSDYTSIQVVGKARNDPNIYHLEDITGRFDPGETVDLLFTLKMKYKDRLRRVGIETTAYQRALIYALEEHMRLRETYFEIVELKARSSKEMRVSGLVPMYKAGVIWHRPTDDALETELMSFPKGKHDDRVDSLAYMTQIIEHVGRHEVAPQFKPKLKSYGIRL